jgi:hypothetical protein
MRRSGLLGFKTWRNGELPQLFPTILLRQEDAKDCSTGRSMLMLAC